MDHSRNIDNQHNTASSVSKTQALGGGPITIIVIDDDNYGFSEKAIRHNFICKVYSIIFCQLMLTLGIMFMAVYHDPFKEYLRTHKFLLFIVSMIVEFLTFMTLGCCHYARRLFPLNFILLFLFTIAISFSIALFSTGFYPLHILYALGLTALITFSLTIFALQTKIDFTVIGGVLFIATVVLLCLIIFAIFFPGHMIRLIISATVAILFSVYLVYDTQLMIGGNHKYSISPDEHILAAIHIYIDIIQIFMAILNLLGTSDND